MNEENINTLAMSNILGKDIMPIVGFFGPYRSTDDEYVHNSLEESYFRALAEAGVKVIMYSLVDYAETPELVMQSLDWCEKYGMKYFVFDSNIYGNVGNDEITAEEIAGYLKKYSDHPAFAGVYAVDEPWTTYYPVESESVTKPIEKYTRVTEVLHELGVLFMAAPLCVWNLDKVKANYERYVAEYCDSLKPLYLCWSNYPFSTNEGMHVYFYNMNIMREHAKRLGIPCWANIQAGAQWNDDKKYFDSELPYYPNEAQFNWNINTCLAFGMQGIDYFPLIQPEHFAWAGTKEEPKRDYRRNGLIGGRGEKNQWWFYAQRIHKHIAAIDEVLMNCVHEGIIATGKTAEKDMRLVSCMMESEQYRELISVSGDAMVGCFDYNGKTALYIVNYSMECAQYISLKFSGNQKIKVIQKAQISHVNTDNLELDMVAGEGVLLVIE